MKLSQDATNLLLAIYRAGTSLVISQNILNSKSFSFWIEDERDLNRLAKDCFTGLEDKDYEEENLRWFQAVSQLLNEGILAGTGDNVRNEDFLTYQFGSPFKITRKGMTFLFHCLKVE